LRSVRSFSLALAGLLACLTAGRTSPLGAQARPTQTQAEALLRERPELVQQLRERIGTSGMTPEQIRARLRAEGYSETLLDAYIGRGNGTNATPDREVFSAVRDLGLADEADLEELMSLAGLRSSDRSGRARSGQPRAIDSLSLRDSTLSEASAELFGLSLFRESTSLFLPNLDGPVDAGYRLGPGDQLVLTLTGDVEESHTLDVARDGSVTIPRIGRVGVANLSLGELESLLLTRLGRVYGSIGRDANSSTRFNVTVSQLRSNQVFVTGDVLTPGSYRITSAGTALTALYAAGGPTDRGSLRRVEVRRGGKAVATLDVYDYLLRGDGSRDVRLQQGDVVFVPVHGGRVRVDGQITRPATYEMIPGETVADVIASAGGLRATAGGRRVMIERILPRADRTIGRERAIVEVPLDLAGTVPSLAVADGDVVRVPGIGDRVRSRVTVGGHVWTGGVQGFTPGLTLSEALRRAGGLKPDAYLGAVLVSRLGADSTRVQLRAMVRDTSGATFQPMPLQEDDEITVYSRTDFRPDRYVAIGGAVKESGRFPWREGMTLRDLVLMAGGLTENAYLKEAEIARVPAVRDARVTATTLRVPLDSGYRFESDAAARFDGSDVALQPHDNVLILQDPEWREPQAVLITGEVRFPGRYTLLSRGERVSSVLRRAGGLTAEANVDGAYFARFADTTAARQVAMTEARQKRRPAGTSDSSSFRADSIAADSIEIDSVGARIRVGVDLREAMRRGNGSDDLIMENGDSVHIPPQRQTVEVRGAVNAPTALAFAGSRLEHYVNAAGGPTEIARSRRAYVIQPNGKIESRRHLLWVIKLDPRPLPGATVVVPGRSERAERPNAVANFAIVTQLLASLAAIVAVTR
jgi:protein involved in polysaccharide export with SLBB domain